MATTLHTELDSRPSYLAAGIASTLVFLLYVLTLGPSTAMWDTSEYIAAAYIFGIPHPPGNPFFVLIGRVFSILPIAPNVAMRINILAALSSAISAGMWFLITERVLVGTGICLVAQRDPIITAKEAASIDLISGGRFVFGVGARTREAASERPDQAPELVDALA